MVRPSEVTKISGWSNIGQALQTKISEQSS
jgi:hypothetical protein